MESKIELTERLRKEGRWSEASVFKDAEVKRLRSEGVRSVEAKEQAWRLMAEKFPPIGQPLHAAFADPAPGERAPSAAMAQTADNPEVDAMLEGIAEGRSSLVADTFWVYENLEQKRIMPDEAPSRGAWSLLQWARQYRSRFFEQFLPKAMKDADDSTERDLIAAEERSIGEIRGILTELRDQAEEETKQSADTAAESFIDEWATQFNPRMSEAARQALRTGIRDQVLQRMKP
jgi:hypothetical protein